MRSTCKTTAPRPSGRRSAVAAVAATGLILFVAPALALDVSSLRTGSYLPSDIGCSGIGGAGELYFDGKNFSGHYQACHTVPLTAQNRFRSTCVEAQGGGQPSAQDIDKDPDRTTAEATIIVKSARAFDYNNRHYQYCEAP